MLKKDFQSSPQYKLPLGNFKKNSLLSYKRGFSVIEIVIAMALLIIMTAVLFVNQTSNKSQKEVEVAARQVAAQLRLLQNDSINGKYIDGQVYKFTFKAEEGKTAYDLIYEYNSEEKGSQNRTD